MPVNQRRSRLKTRQRSSHEVVLLEIQLKYRVLDRGKHETDVLRVCTTPIQHDRMVPHSLSESISKVLISILLKLQAGISLSLSTSANFTPSQ